MTYFVLNGERVQAEVPPETPLLWVLRDVLHRTGTKFGCGAGLCGACTVHVNGEATRSCQAPIGDLADAKVTTIEGMAKGAELHPLQKAWIAEQVPQCGYCQPGMIMAAAALLEELPHPTEEDVRDRITNLCRCGTYGRIVKAVLRAADEMAPTVAPEPEAVPAEPVT